MARRRARKTPATSALSSLLFFRHQATSFAKGHRQGLTITIIPRNISQFRRSFSANNAASGPSDKKSAVPPETATPSDKPLVNPSDIINTPYGPISLEKLAEMHQNMVATSPHKNELQPDADREMLNTAGLITVDQIIALNLPILIAAQAVFSAIFFIAAYFGAVADTEWPTVVINTIGLSHIDREDLSELSPLGIAYRATVAALPYLLLFPWFFWPSLYELSKKVGYYPKMQRRFIEKNRLAKLALEKQEAAERPEQIESPPEKAQEHAATADPTKEQATRAH